MEPSAPGSRSPSRCRERQTSAPSSLAARALVLALGFSAPPAAARAPRRGPRARRRALREQQRDGCLGAFRRAEVPRIPVAVAGVDRDARADQRGVHRAERLRLADHCASGRLERRPETLERREGLGADDPVDVVADVALEVADRSVGLAAQDAVLLTCVETERVQAPLELPDVVPAEERIAQVQGAVADPVPGFHELTPRVGADESVHGKSAGPVGTRGPPRVSCFRTRPRVRRPRSGAPRRPSDVGRRARPRLDRRAG